MKILAKIALFALSVMLKANAQEGQCDLFQTQNVGNRRLVNSDYNYFHLSADETKVGGTSFVKVFIKSSGDSYINFMSETPENSNPEDHSPQIVLGGWHNTQSGAYCHRSQDWTRYNTPNVVSASEYREFVISWTYVSPTIFIVRVYSNGELLFKHTFNCVSSFSGIGFASAWGHNGDWKLCREICETFDTHNVGNRRLVNSDYTYYPLPADLATLSVGRKSFLKLYVRSTGDSYINFMAKTPEVSSPEDRSAQIVLGGWSNTQSGAYCHRSQDWTRFNTPNILSGTEFREFFIVWTYVAPNDFKVSVFGNDGLLFTHSFDCVNSLSGMGFASAWGHNASWKMCYVP